MTADETEPVFTAALLRATAHLGLTVDPPQVQMLCAHFRAVVEANAHFNLTRVTDPAAAAVKLYADSLAPLAWVLRKGLNVQHCADVGTGAGFPAVPLAVLCPQWQVRALDSTGKKANFLREWAGVAGLINLDVRHARGGEGQPEGLFDLVVFKAVAALEACLQYARSLVAFDGWVVVFKGPNVAAREVAAARNVGVRIGLRAETTYAYTLPCGAETLHSKLFIYRSR